MADARHAAAAATPRGAERPAPSAPAETAPLPGRRFFSSWSGGKDAYLALQRATLRHGHPAALLSMLHEHGRVSRGHGLPVGLLQAQAAALRLPLVTRATTWDGYRDAFIDALGELRGMGVEAGVFGDIDLREHREWVEGVCDVAGLSCHLPLWQESRRELYEEFLAGGARATIVAVDQTKLTAAYLGRSLDDALRRDLESEGVDVCGEEGEYHTMVTWAPLFAAPVPLTWSGIEERDGHWVLRYSGAEEPSADHPSAPTAHS